MFYGPTENALKLDDMFKGTTAFLVLNGPSLLQLPLEKLKEPGFFSVGINNGPRNFRPDMWITCDRPRKFLPSLWHDPHILKFVRKRHFKQRIWDLETGAESDVLARDCANVIWFQASLKFDAREFLSCDTVQFGVHRARSSMLAAIKILYVLGIRTIYLLGCDFSMDADKPYFFTEPVPSSHADMNNNSYRHLAQLFERLNPHFLEHGLQIFNCNPNSHLRVFPMADFATVTGETQRKMLELQAREKNSSLYYKTAP